MRNYKQMVHQLTDHLAMDISADLLELGRTPVAVVCAGVKSILDIGKTLEYLVSIIAGAK
jgi:pseudouridine-5'-phosphate glycosidase